MKLELEIALATSVAWLLLYSVNRKLVSQGHRNIYLVVPGSTCPDGFALASNNICYRFYAQIETYANARGICEAHNGATLAVPESSDENSIVMNLTPGETVWLGVNDITTEGK